MKNTLAARRVVVTPDGTGVTSHVGSLLIAEAADRLGFTAAVSQAMSETVKRSRRHDPGVVLTHMATVLVDGGDCLSDLAVLRDQPDLFGDVASDPTAWRVISSGWARGAIEHARAAARARAWSAGMGPETVTIDIDATLVAAHSDKEDAAPNYKGGFGHHPIGAWCDETGEALAAIVRPGNAGANNAADHIEVLSRAVDQLPCDYQAGHGVGDDPMQAAYPMLVRTDSAGASHDFVRECLQRNCEVSIGHRIDAPVREALEMVDEGDWIPAAEADGSLREGAWVSELTHLIDLTGWGKGVRLICRRERPHPGAQLSFFDEDNGLRHQCFITNSHGSMVHLEVRHRRHAHVEDEIREAKAMGLSNLPFQDLCPNEVWVELVLAAQDLLAWVKGLCLDGSLGKSEIKRLRYALFHVGARVVHSARRVRVAIAASWPWARELAAAFAKLRLVPTG